MGKLTDRKVQAAKPGKHGDGDGLWLVVSPSVTSGKLSRKWVLRFAFEGRERNMGLGPYPKVSLARARQKATEARAKVEDHVDPIAERRKPKEKAKPIPTFGAAADAYVKANRASWRNEKHVNQWVMTLRKYCEPIRSKPVNLIDTEAVLSVLQPHWQRAPETASRLRGRIEAIMNAARASGHIDKNEANPARWRGHLDQLLAQRKPADRGHHAAMSYNDVPAFIAKIREQETVAAGALEFCILTASRTTETLHARWSEFDLNSKVWTLPADRMKGGREHRIPLSNRVLEILQLMKSVASGEYVFPGRRVGRPLSNMSFGMFLRRAAADCTTHGFRSSFRDWAGDRTNFPRELAEHALAHSLGDKSELAYRRGDALERRRALMSAWADFCEPSEATNNVTKFRPAKGA